MDTKELTNGNIQDNMDLLMPHNIPVYKHLKDSMAETGSVLLQAATGTGKSYIAAEFIRNSHKHWLVVTPRNSLEDMWEGLKEKYALDLDTITYQGLSQKKEYEVIEISGKYDGFVFDEAHHVAAISWNNAVTILMSTGKPTLGLSADSLRYSDGIDVAEKYFSSKVHSYTLGEGINAGILPSFQYIKAMFNMPEFKEASELPSEKKREFSRLLTSLEFTVENQNSISKILAKHLGDSAHKIIVFVENTKDLPRAKECLKGIVKAENVFMMYHKQKKARNLENLRRFMNCSDTAAVINVNILTEGIHVDGADVLVMLRRTESPAVFFQQLGRIVSATAMDKELMTFDFVGNYRSVKSPFRQTSDAVTALNMEIKDKEKQIIVTDYCQDALDIIQNIESLLGLNWLKSEDDILRKYYPSEGMDVADRLPGRTRGACKRRALCIGLHVRHKTWTLEDIETLKKYYPLEGSNVSERFTNHTPKACVQQAFRLGIQSNIGKSSWTDTENQILMQFYVNEGMDKVAKRLPGRTPEQCKYQANRLGLKRHYWSDEEIEILKKYYPKVGKRIVEYLPQHSVEACYTKAKKLNLKTNFHQWTDEQIDILKKVYPEGGAQACAELIGKHFQTCRKKARELGIDPV